MAIKIITVTQLMKSFNGLQKHFCYCKLHDVGEIALIESAKYEKRYSVTKSTFKNIVQNFTNLDATSNLLRIWI